MKCYTSNLVCCCYFIILICTQYCLQCQYLRYPSGPSITSISIKTHHSDVDGRISIFRILSNASMNFASACLLFLTWLQWNFALRHNKFAVSGCLCVGWKTCSQFNIFQLHARIPWHLAQCTSNLPPFPFSPFPFPPPRKDSGANARHWNTNFKLNFCGLSLFTSGFCVCCLHLPSGRDPHMKSNRDVLVIVLNKIRCYKRINLLSFTWKSLESNTIYWRSLLYLDTEYFRYF